MYVFYLRFHENRAQISHRGLGRPQTTVSFQKMQSSKNQGVLDFFIIKFSVCSISSYEGVDDRELLFCGSGRAGHLGRLDPPLPPIIKQIDVRKLGHLKKAKKPR